MIKSPCYGCVPPERRVGCHADCPRYAGWKTWSEGWRETRAREAEANAVRKLTEVEFNRRNDRYSEEKRKTRREEGIK